jgi:hypothetical protein
MHHRLFGISDFDQYGLYYSYHGVKVIIEGEHNRYASTKGRLTESGVLTSENHGVNNTQWWLDCLLISSHSLVRYGGSGPFD